jgi:hypothetical protein
MGVVDLPNRMALPRHRHWRQVDCTRFSKTRDPAVIRYNFTPDAVLGSLASEGVRMDYQTTAANPLKAGPRAWAS